MTATSLAGTPANGDSATPTRSSLASADANASQPGRPGRPGSLDPALRTREAVVSPEFTDARGAEPSAFGADIALHDIYKIAKAIRILSLFGGPSKEDGLDTFVREYGAAISVFDTEISPTHDLVDECTWQTIRDDLDGQKYHATLIAAPCSSFSGGRRNDGGPRPLRGEHAPEIYGFKHLSPAEKSAVRIGTACAFRGIEAANIMVDQGQPFVFETPRQRPGKPSLFKLPEAKALQARDGVSVKSIVQCELGARTTKPTDMKTYKVDMSSFPTLCTHQPRWWVIPWCETYHWGAHPLLTGRQWMLEAERWRPHMLRWREPDGPYISRSAAAYPLQMNKLLAEKLVRAACATRLRQSQCSAMVRTGRWANTLVASHRLRTAPGGIALTTGSTVATDTQVLRTPTVGRPASSDIGDGAHSSGTHVTGLPRVAQVMKLRPGDPVDMGPLYDANTCIGGLVDCWTSVQRVTGHATVGPQISAILDTWLDANPQAENTIFDAIGKDAVDPVAMESLVDTLRQDIANFLCADGGHIDTAPIASELYSTHIRGHLLHSWLLKASDPAAPICEWLWKGAPAGLKQDFNVLDGIFPRVKPEDPDLDVDHLQTDFASFTNYSGVEEDDAVFDILKTYETAGYFKRCRTLKQVRAFLGRAPVLTKVGAVKKVKINPVTKAEKIKTRIIVDSKEAGTSRAARRTHKSNLPQAAASIKGFLGLMKNSDYHPRDAGVEFLVVDFTDAFWNIPLHHDERPYFVIKYRGAYLIFLRTAQGSRGAPLTWAAVASLLARVSQSMFMDAKAQRARLQVYVDDPLLGLQGTSSARRRMAVKFITIFLVLGVRLAFDKAQFGPRVSWIGVDIAAEPWKITAQIPDTKLVELEEMATKFLTANVVAIKPLRSFAGKATNIATLVFAWRPFLNQIWAAMSALDVGTSQAPRNCVWTRQIETSLWWIIAFVKRQVGAISRTFTYNAHFGVHSPIEITTDASIWGFGGWLSIRGRPVEWFSEPITPEDERALGHARGNHEGQQAFEAFTLLLAIRLWAREWKDERYVLILRNDNIGALTIYSSLKGRSCPMNAIAREYALDISEGVFEPSLIQHIPGITNAVADVLSRRFDPQYSRDWTVPAQLAGAKRRTVPRRDASWWRASKPPSPGSASTEIFWGEQT